MDKVPANKRTFAALVTQSSDILCGTNTDLPKSTPLFADSVRTFRDFAVRPAAAVSPAVSARVGQGCEAKRGECPWSGGFTGCGTTRSGGFTPPPQRCNAGSCGDVKSPLHLPCRVSPQPLYAADGSFCLSRERGRCVFDQGRAGNSGGEISIACEPYLCCDRMAPAGPKP